MPAPHHAAEPDPVSYPRCPDRPAGRCAHCLTRSWRQRPDGGWVCDVCHPAAPGAETGDGLATAGAVPGA